MFPIIPINLSTKEKDILAICFYCTLLITKLYRYKFEFFYIFKLQCLIVTIHSWKILVSFLPSPCLFIHNFFLLWYKHTFIRRHTNIYNHKYIYISDLVSITLIFFFFSNSYSHFLIKSFCLLDCLLSFFLLNFCKYASISAWKMITLDLDLLGSFYTISFHVL